MLDRRCDDRARPAPSTTREQGQRRACCLIAAGVQGHLVGAHAQTIRENLASAVEQGPGATAVGVPSRRVGPGHLVRSEQGLQSLREDRPGGRVEEAGGARRTGGCRAGVWGVLMGRIALSRHVSRLMPPFVGSALLLR